MASELPGTIEGCVSEIAKTSRRSQEYCDLCAKITELSIPRFNIILSLLDEMTAYCIAPDTVGEGFWEYREFIRNKEVEKYEMYGKGLRYCYEFKQDGSKAEMFKYVSGEEEGYPRFRYYSPEGMACMRLGRFERKGIVADLQRLEEAYRRFERKSKEQIVCS